RRFPHLAEHLRTGGLVEADRVVLGAAPHADGLQPARHTEPGDVRGQLGLLEAEPDERDGTEVVDLVGLYLFKRCDQAGQILQITGDQFHERQLRLQGLELRVVLSLDQTENLVVLAVQQLCEILAVLTGDPGDQCTSHRGENSQRPAGGGRLCPTRSRPEFFPSTANPSATPSPTPPPTPPPTPTVSVGLSVGTASRPVSRHCQSTPGRRGSTR